MSAQLFLLNGMLRIAVKPAARYLAVRADKVHQYRPMVCRAAGLLAMPDHIHIEPLDADSFQGEWLHSLRAVKVDERVVLYIPGGAFSIGSPITHRGITARLAHFTGCRVLAVNYSKAPEHPYPAALHDVLNAYQWLLDQGVPSNNVVIAGDSSGGNLTLATLQALRDANSPLPAAGICLSPWADLAGNGVSMRFNRRHDAMVPYRHIKDAARKYAGQIPLDDARVSPLYGNFSGLPPLLIHAGDKELLFSDATRLASRARRAGVNVDMKIWRNAPHAFQLFAGLVPQSNHSLRQISSWIQQL
ncbi:MAG: alpha/beta hydrolase [Alcanivoracaceae bacterium]